MTQALRDHPARVIAHIDGVAASAATHVMLAGDEIIMAPQAMLMIHQAWMFLYGNSDELLKAAALMEKYDNLQANAYSKRTKKTDAQMLDMMRAETWFTPEEAIAIGLADSIAEVEPKSAAQANASLGWDLSAFDHAPKPKSQSVPASHRIDVAVFLESLSQRERSIAIA
jgi:ATP-dependent protease ClpP protease subunit